MRFNIYKSKRSVGENHFELVGEVQASSLDVASDMVYRRLRKKLDKENGQAYFIVPLYENMKLSKKKITSLKGMPFRVVQYRNINEDL